MPKSLPARPNLHWLKNRAKDRRRKDTSLKLAAAQLAVAREYGFASWRKLKDAVIAAGPDDTQRRELVLKQFRTAVNNSDVAGLGRLLRTEELARQSINEPIFAFDSPPIVHAWRNLKIVDLLLQYGADINRKSSWWAGPWGVLDHADRKTAKALIQRGAVVDIFAAAKLGDLKRLRAFLDADTALVHAKGGDGCRPLHFVTSRRAIDLLLERGADIDARDLDHEATAAQWGIWRGGVAGGRKFDRVRYLLQRGAQPDVFLAIALDAPKLLANLLTENPAAWNVRVGEPGYAPCPTAPGRHIYVYRFGDGKTLHEAAADFASKKCLALLRTRSTPRQRFIIACTLGDAPAARAELAANPGITASLTVEDQRALPDAAFNGNAKAVKLMLDLGFDPLAKNKDGATALHCAAWKGNAKIVHMILNHRASRNLHRQLVAAVETTYGAKPLGWCCHGSLHCRNPKGDYPQVAHLLLAAGAVPLGRIEASDDVKRVLKV